MTCFKFFIQLLGYINALNYKALFCMLLLPTVCDDYLGMANGDIPDESINASSEFLHQQNSKGYARQARLNGTSWWRANGSIVEPWIQADIGYQTYVSGVVTQGDGRVGGDWPDWVATLKVSTFFMSTTDTEVFVRYSNGTAWLVSVHFFQNGLDLYSKIYVSSRHKIVIFSWTSVKIE